MSAAKRRAKRKIALVVRMDATRYRMRGRRAEPLIAAMMALGKALTRKGLRARGIKAVGDARNARGEP